MTTKQIEELRAEYLLVKRGLYYGPGNRGYTGVKDRAGRYHQSDADELSGVTAVHESEAPMFSPACWEDVKVAFLLDRIKELEATLTERSTPESEEEARLAIAQQSAKPAEGWEAAYDWFRSEGSGIIRGQRAAESEVGQIAAIAKAVCWHYYGLAWEHAERQSRDEIQAMVRAMLSASPDRGEG